MLQPRRRRDPHPTVTRRNLIRAPHETAGAASSASRRKPSTSSALRTSRTYRSDDDRAASSTYATAAIRNATTRARRFSQSTSRNRRAADASAHGQPKAATRARLTTATVRAHAFQCLGRRRSITSDSASAGHGDGGGGGGGGATRASRACAVVAGSRVRRVARVISRVAVAPQHTAAAIKNLIVASGCVGAPQCAPLRGDSRALGGSV